MRLWKGFGMGLSKTVATERQHTRTAAHNAARKGPHARRPAWLWRHGWCNTHKTTPQEPAVEPTCRVRRHAHRVEALGACGLATTRFKFSRPARL